MISSRHFLPTVIIVALVFGLLAHFISWVNSVSACKLPDSPPGVFFSACNAAYGEYEHGAYYYELESNAVLKAKHAEVLFLGSSRTQFGFSTKQTRTFFLEKNISYYLLGFGYVEQAPFAIELINRLNLNPRIMIVNVDPFFSSYVSAIAQPILNGNLLTHMNYIFKRLLTEVREPYCSLSFSHCEKSSRAIYRDPNNGEWIWANVFLDPNTGHPLKTEVQQATSQERASYIEEAKKFFSNLKIPAHCVVLTSAPSDLFSDDQLVKEIAQAVGGAVPILPKVPNVIMVDDHHLNLPTAERWSEAVLNEMGPVLERCLEKQTK